MYCRLGFSQSNEGCLLVLVEIEQADQSNSGVSVTRFVDENLFIHAVCIQDFGEDVTAAIVANVLLVLSGGVPRNAWIRLDLSDAELKSLGLTLPHDSQESSLDDACDYLLGGDLRNVLMQSPTPIALLSGSQHRYIFVNPPAARLSGRSVESMIGKTVREALPEIRGQAFIPLLDRVYATGEAYVGREIPGEWRNERTGKRETNYLDFVYHPVRNRSGEVCGIFCHVNDVTERVLARHVSEDREAKLYWQWAELEAIYLKSPVALSLVSAADYRFLRANKKTAELLGIPVDDLIGQCLFDLKNFDRLRPIYESIAAGEEMHNVRLDLITSHDPLQVRRLLVSFSPVRGVTGEVEAIASVAVNLPDKIASQTRLVFDLSVASKEILPQ